MIIVIIVSLVILFIITWIVIACNGCNNPCTPPYCGGFDYSYQSWEARIESLESADRDLRRQMKDLHYNLNCSSMPMVGNYESEEIYEAKKEKKEILEILLKSQKTAEQLAKDLNMEIEK